MRIGRSEVKYLVKQFVAHFYSGTLTLGIKIEGPGRMQGTGTVRRAGKAEGGPRGTFAKQLVGETASTGGVTGAGAMGGVDGLFALQEVDNPTERASKGKKRAVEILEHLEDLRHGLLSGGLTPEKLTALSRVVQNQRDQIDDPRLAEILDEIDLRAQVELAKYEMAS
ncbi:Flagellar assembly protein FliX [uncultured Gammaproteobacteria bacterium]